MATCRILSNIARNLAAKRAFGQARIRQKTTGVDGKSAFYRRNHRYLGFFGMLVGRRNIQNTNNAMQAPPINRIFFDPPLGAVTAVTAGRSVTATVVVVSTSSMALVFSACAGFSLSNVAASLAESKWADALEREASSIALLEGVCQFQLLCETSRPLS